jgi:hypothetical protein
MVGQGRTTTIQERSEIGEAFPEGFDPHSLIPRHRVPEFPFAEEMAVPEKSQEEKIEEARRYFEHHGFVLVGTEGGELIFRDSEGGITRINVSEKRMGHWPKP